MKIHTFLQLHKLTWNRDEIRKIVYINDKAIIPCKLYMDKVIVPLLCDVLLFDG